MPFSQLFSEGLPLLISIDLGIYHERYPEPPRLAVLRGQEGLRIFKGGQIYLSEEFFLPEQGVIWDDMRSFTSIAGALPGVVVWGAGEYAHEFGTVVCYVDGRFEVVFQGEDLRIVDLDLDNFPEIVASRCVLPDKGKPWAWLTVWVWNGKKYVHAARVPDSQLWSRQVVEAVRRIAKQRTRSSTA